ncbi:hypothetical protein N7492_007653 [Penicillium capsulatum]|uniref:Zn(2)-C6 fungal-type domain-containing protein n=1 Tax=Penicillium capsulatum TaxID=69766 RepID=A0A9W9I2N1_9EURO|nr:hypothetical protein N7492_007653 [Penicillium capsulatum]KAJ6117487.1 hypothetical protein N7512_007212 [Penicillium capsulatum]
MTDPGVHGGQPAPDSTSAKPFSCVVCHKRKVKCDRKEPCANCEKAQIDCIYCPPPPPRRRKRERDEASASQEREKSLRRISDEPSSDHPVHHTIAAKTQRAELGREKSGTGRLIIKEGNSVYLDDTLWTSVSHELPNAADVLDNESDSGGDDNSHDEMDEASMLLSHTPGEKPTELHPNPLHIFKLWQTFLENVNPLTKIVHAPTVQQQILEAMGDLHQIGREFEALMFSIYCVALISLSADEVSKSFGESKKKLLSRCRRGAQLAFTNAHLLRTSNVVVLQAFLLFILSMRAFSDPHTTWSLSGVALRIAQRIGIHRDGSGYGLSIFDTEMRRRIWLQLTIIDYTSAQFAGVSPSPMPQTADTKPPMNANDSDLDPRMTEPACGKEGPTEMIFSLARSEFGRWLRRWSKDAGTSHSVWAFLSSSTITMEEKDVTVDELERCMEEKFLRYCDQSIPLHLATTMMVRSAVHFTRLMAHHPRQYRDSSARISQAEKDLIFENCLKMAEYANHTQNNSSIHKFSWHTMNHMPWDAMIHMLSEIPHRTDPVEKSRAWQIIGGIYSRHLGQMRKKVKMPLHTAIQNLMVKAWKAYVDGCHLHRQAPTACPPIVVSLLDDAKGIGASQIAGEGSKMSEHGEFSEQPGQHDVTAPFVTELDNFESLLNSSPMDWNEWDNLLNQFQASLVDDIALMPGS